MPAMRSQGENLGVRQGVPGFIRLDRWIVDKKILLQLNNEPGATGWEAATKAINDAKARIGK